MGSSLRRSALALLPLAFPIVALACGDTADPPPDEDSGTADAATTDGSTPEADGGSSDGAAKPDTSAPSDGGGSVDGGDGGTACGAAVGKVCPPGATCATDDDCEGTCTANVCATPTRSDGRLSPSLGETDVDCGGAGGPACEDEKVCAIDTDCKSSVCGAAKRCVGGASCRGSTNGPSGIDTCGTGEPGAPGAKVESCCRSLPLPTRTARRLDRYEITSGRVRAFVDALAAANGGVPNMRAFAMTYAATHPGSQLAEVMDGYPGLLDVLPNQASPTARLPLPVFLGAFPLDPINSLDGCFVGDGAYGHPTYWQPPSSLQPYGVGKLDAQGRPTGQRHYTREELDKKPANCMSALVLATFCAWDGGELARTADYREIWGRKAELVGATNVYVPWTALLPIGQFNWRNGHGTTCSPAAWPGCQNPQPYFFGFPATKADGSANNPADDDSPAIAAPGRFASDITRITSASGEGWYDVGGNLMESAWPVGTVNPGVNAVQDVCDVSAGPGPGEDACVRRGNNGVLRYQGALPHVALVGYSFEGHARRSENYLSAVAANELLIPAGDLKPVHFQYGKIGGRCARSR